ncbi:MAG: hypothetical protein QOG77_2116 [Solirubrobacteraceae bacterium]|jgi:uncharacterized protein YciI|nr:hypothetical protein [Solirubrobacteraceae bacterium]
MFAFISEYQKPLDEVDKHREAHLAFLAGLNERGVILVSGRRKPPVGGVVVIDAEDLEAATAIMAEDPFAVAGVAVYQPYEFTPSAGPSRSPEAEAFLARRAGNP